MKFYSDLGYEVVHNEDGEPTTHMKRPLGPTEEDYMDDDSEE